MVTNSAADLKFLTAFGIFDQYDSRHTVLVIQHLMKASFQRRFIPSPLRR